MRVKDVFTFPCFYCLPLMASATFPPVLPRTQLLWASLSSDVGISNAATQTRLQGTKSSQKPEKPETQNELLPIISCMVFFFLHWPCKADSNMFYSLTENCQWQNSQSCKTQGKKINTQRECNVVRALTSSGFTTFQQANSAKRYRSIFVCV